MKLGILVPAFPAQTHVFFWREAAALESLGHEVVFLSTRRPTEPCPHDFAMRAEQRTHYVFPPRARRVAASLTPSKLRAVARYLAALSDRGAALARTGVTALCAADLAAYAREREIEHIHVHSCADAAHLAALARLLDGPSYSLHLHGDLPVYGRDHRQKMEHALFVAAAARPMQRQLIEDVPLPPERTFTMIMGVDMDRFRPAPDTPRHGPFTLVTVARLALCKGHRHALAAVRAALNQGVDVRYVIAGAGPERAAIQAEIDRLELSGHVELLGSLSEGEVASLLQHCHAFMLASVGEGEASPVAMMEAMAAGVPPICSIIGGTSDMIQDSVDGLLVSQADEAGLTRALLRLARDEDYRRGLARAARARAERDFDHKKLAQRFIEVLTRLRRGG